MAGTKRPRSAVASGNNKRRVGHQEQTRTTNLASSNWIARSEWTGGHCKVTAALHTPTLTGLYNGQTWDNLPSHTSIQVTPAGSQRAVRYSRGDVLEVELDGEEERCPAVILDIREDIHVGEYLFIVAWYYPEQLADLSEPFPEGKEWLLSDNVQVLLGDAFRGDPYTATQRWYTLHEKHVRTWQCGEQVELVVLLEGDNCFCEAFSHRSLEKVEPAGDIVTCE